MPHQYKLIYFNTRGRAEPLRLIFSYAGVNFVDERIERENWPALKPKTVFGQIPILDIDNGKVVLAQSKAIGRYLGKEFNLVPNDNLLAAKGDMLIDGYEDLGKHFIPFLLEKDPAKKKEIWQKFEAEQLTPFLKLYEKFLTETGTGYFLTNSITWVDIFLFDGLEKFKLAAPQVLDKYPKLAEFCKKVSSEPKIKAWIDKRPKE